MDEARQGTYREASDFVIEASYRKYDDGRMRNSELLDRSLTVDPWIR